MRRCGHTGQLSGRLTCGLGIWLRSECLSHPKPLPSLLWPEKLSVPQRLLDASLQSSSSIFRQPTAIGCLKSMSNLLHLKLNSTFHNLRKSCHLLSLFKAESWESISVSSFALLNPPYSSSICSPSKCFPLPPTYISSLFTFLFLHSQQSYSSLHHFTLDCCNGITSTLVPSPLHPGPCSMPHAAAFDIFQHEVGIRLGALQ